MKPVYFLFRVFNLYFKNKWSIFPTSYLQPDQFLFFFLIITKEIKYYMGSKASVRVTSGKDWWLWDIRKISSCLAFARENLNWVIANCLPWHNELSSDSRTISTTSCWVGASYGTTLAFVVTSGLISHEMRAFYREFRMRLVRTMSSRIDTKRFPVGCD